jgi:hypothetical protein
LCAWCELEIKIVIAAAAAAVVVVVVVVNIKELQQTQPYLALHTYFGKC